MFEKIVVGTDGSEPSHHALRIACDLAAKYGSELHLVHTPQPQAVAFALGAVAGYHVATTMPSADEVAAAADKVIAQGRNIAEDCGQTLTSTYVAGGGSGGSTDRRQQGPWC